MSLINNTAASVAGYYTVFKSLLRGTCRNLHTPGNSKIPLDLLYSLFLHRRSALSQRTSKRNHCTLSRMHVERRNTTEFNSTQLNATRLDMYCLTTQLNSTDPLGFQAVLDSTDPVGATASQP
jgi:hypothetical protein